MSKKPTIEKFEKSLFEAGIEYVAKFSAPRAQVEKMLQRRVQRWMRRNKDLGEEELLQIQEDATALFPKILDRLEKLGGINDEVYAKNKIRGFVETGKGRRFMSMKLKAKGVAPDLVADSLEKTIGEVSSERANQIEMFSALKFVRSRRLGPFETPREIVLKEGQRLEDFKRAEFAKSMGKLARQGFPFDVARKALEMDLDEARTFLEECSDWEE